MTWSTSLVIDNGSGEQVVRRPRRTDAVGASLREAFTVGSGLPDDLAQLLRQLDRTRPRCH